MKEGIAYGVCVACEKVYSREHFDKFEPQHPIEILPRYRGQKCTFTPITIQWNKINDRNVY